VVSVRKAVLEKEMERLGERGHEAADFFREEYKLNHLIWEMNDEEGRGEGEGSSGKNIGDTSSKLGENSANNNRKSTPSSLPPLQLSLWDGVIMGGGVGLSIGSAFRMATEKTLFAMPETAIGFFPDVGGSYWLPRVGREGGREGVSALGRYIGLTGVRLGGWDLVKAGTATHFVKSEKVEEVVREVEGLREGGRGGGLQGRVRREEVEAVLRRWVVGGEEAREGVRGCLLARREKEIEEVFGGEGGREGGVEGVFRRLEAMVAAEEEGGREGRREWAEKTLALLRKASPTALKVTWRLLEEGERKGREGGRAATFSMEYRVAMGHMNKESDFCEGVRALLVEKGAKPGWRKGRVEEVSEEEVDVFFRDLGENKLKVV